MARRSEEGSGLPSFFQDNPWLDIFGSEGVEPSLDFVVSKVSSVPTLSEAMSSSMAELCLNYTSLVS